MKCVVFTSFRASSDLVALPQKVLQQAQWTAELAPYKGCGSVSLIYIFLPEGYRALLAGGMPFRALAKEKTMREVLLKAAANAGVADRIQIVGIEELIPTMAHLQEIAEARDVQLSSLLLGQGISLYYDSPKMIEATIRLARGAPGSQLPDEALLRFDEDVSVNRDGIQALLDFHEQTLPDDMRSRESFHFFSGNYLFHKPTDLLNDYAVRTHHFALPDPQQRGAYALERGQPNHDLAQQWVDSIADIGANPHNQVISGAGTHISLQSIQTLPPFANVGTLIVWIDDHLKRLLHEALGHLELSPAQVGQPDVSYRRCESAKFEQDRYPQGLKKEEIDKARSQYLPRLVRGCVMDALIWDRQSAGLGLYAKAVKQVLAGGRRPSTQDLRRDLESPARKHLDKVIATWGAGCYKGYPVYDFATSDLPPQIDRYIEEVVSDLDRYLGLLQMWPLCVELCAYLDKGNHPWLFREA